jgi:hypothetical protein
VRREDVHPVKERPEQSPLLQHRQFRPGCEQVSGGHIAVNLGYPDNASAWSSLAMNRVRFLTG